MTIQPISSTGIALFIGASDLQERGITAESLDLDDAKKIASEAFAGAGIDVDCGMEIEAFSGSCGILVFARLLESFPAVYQFEDIEQLLSGVRAIAQPGALARLTYYDGAYYLGITEGWQRAQILCEYGKKLEGDTALWTYLREHGKKLTDEISTDNLLELFGEL